MGDEPAGSDQDVGGVGEVPEVFPIDEEQIDTQRRRALLQRVGDAEQYRHAGGAIVRTRDGEALLPKILALVGVGTGVPVRQEQHALGGRRLESGEEVTQPQRVAPRRAPCDVGDLLDDDGIGAGTQLRQDPVARRAMRGRPGDARAERHLLLHIAERRLPVELSCPATRTGLAGQDPQCDAPRTTHHALFHRSCPTLVASWTNAVITI